MKGADRVETSAHRRVVRDVQHHVLESMVGGNGFSLRDWTTPRYDDLCPRIGGRARRSESDAARPPDDDDTLAVERQVRC
jgi:hypothetical protein